MFQKNTKLHDELLKDVTEERVTPKLVDITTRWNDTLRMPRNFMENERTLRVFYASEARKAGEKFPLAIVAVRGTISS